MKQTNHNQNQITPAYPSPWSPISTTLAQIESVHQETLGHGDGNDAAFTMSEPELSKAKMPHTHQKHIKQSLAHEMHPGDPSRAASVAESDL